MYQELLKQYNELSDEEKNALLVYKTRLGLLINDLDNEPDWETYYERYKRLSESPQNILVQTLIFNSIDFTSLDTFKESIFKIKDVLKEATTKIIVPEDLHVFRSISSNSDIDGLSKSDFISTSLSFAESCKYAILGKNIRMYDITIPAGSRVGISPYRVLDDQRNDRLTISQSSDQEEVIIDANNYEFEVQKEYDNGDIILSEISATDINKKQARN